MNEEGESLMVLDDGPELRTPAGLKNVKFGDRMFPWLPSMSEVVISWSRGRLLFCGRIDYFEVVR